MRHSAAPPWFGHEFDNFLFAKIGENNNGLPLTVVSMLGRSNLDPWAEAASLTKLSKEIATQRLASLLRALPNSSLQQDTGTIATRLIALLPLQTNSKVRLPVLTAGAGAAAHPRALMQVLLIGLYIACLLATALAITHLKAIDINPTHASDSSIAPAQTLPTPYR